MDSEIKADIVDEYWICLECAREKEWEFPDWIVTGTRGVCGYCVLKGNEDVKLLIPTVDFRRMKRKLAEE